MEQAKKEHRRHFYFQHRLANGDIRDVEVYSGPIQLQGRQLLYSIVHDITERKKMEEALLESEEKYKFLAENMVDIVWILDRDFRTTYVSPSIKKALGFTPEERKRQTLEEMITLESLQSVQMKFLEELQRDEEGGFDPDRPVTIEVEYYRKDGSTVWMENSVKAIRDFAGEIVGMHGVSRDITERKQAEEILQESELKFRNLFDLSPQAIALTEVETGKLVDINNKFCELTQYSKEDLIGRNTTEAGFYSEEDRSVFIKELQASGEVDGLEMDFKSKDGSILTALMFARVIKIAEKPLILTIFIDVTTQKQLEAQLQQAHKMEAIGTLAGGVAHDFNNLMMGMLGNISLVIHETDPAHPHYEMLKHVDELIQSGSKLTRQLLGYARKGKYEVKPASLNKIVKESSETFGRTKKEIKIRQALAENLYAIEADETQIQQVLLNLYINAADAMPGGGDLSIKTVNITHTEMQGKAYDPKPGNYVMLKVTDNGTGMDEATMKCIFDPFFTTKEMGRGTGLGLASVYGIVKAHGGYIDVDSKKGYGTSFIIYLPASDDLIHEASEVSERIEEGTETILLVDDEEMVLDVGVKMLEKIGYVVLEAKSGQKSIETYKENKVKIDLVILDMIMPEIGGGEAFDKMKEINPDVKALLSSGYSIDGGAQEILDRGCNGFIQKPFNLKDLSQKIREILDKD
jgi:PAS domain S-box-containing protein